VDADKTNRIFINIISNALHYTGKGGAVRVSCAQVGREGMTGFYRYVIEDNGVGMSEEYQQHLFEEFTRETDTTATDVQGPGFGLSIAKSLISALNGKIEFHSKQGKGTTFTITFPFRLQEAERTSQYTDPITRDTLSTYPGKGDERVGAKTAPLENKRVLLVEDNEMNREIETFVLENEKIIVETAKDGADAVNIVKEKGPDYFAAILMDIQMPVMNGYEATKAIREMFPDSKLPIIAVSANAFQEDKDASIAAGMNAHVS